MTPTIEIDDLVKTYGDDQHPVPVLKGIDLSIAEGEFVAIRGPSGSGKSTLLNILGCLDRPTSGTYRIKGEDVSTFDDRALSRLRNRRIGFVFQSFHLISHLTVVENIELPRFYSQKKRAERRRRALELVDRVGLSHRHDHLPNALSGGEKQRVAIARALANEPSLLLTDEPTGNLDSQTSESIMDLFHELHGEGRTVVMITHDPEIASAAPRCVTLRDGKIQSDDVQVSAAGTSEVSS